MKTLFLDEICRCIAGRCDSDPAGIAVSGVSTDSREVKQRDLFVAIHGQRFDGHDFVAKAFLSGASGAVVRQMPDNLTDDQRKRVLQVDDTVMALGQLARYYRRGLAGTVIAVTGSNGKTTTKEMVYHILSKHHTASRSRKSYNNHIGVPLTLLAGEPSDQFLVAEVGSNHPGEIDALGRIIEPDIVVITNVSETHLEGFGTIERVAREKSALTRYVRPGGAIIVNGDDDLLVKLSSRSEAILIRFGLSNGNDLRATNVVSTNDGIKFTMNDRFDVSLPVLGRHNAVNCLAAIAVARRMGLQTEQIADDLRDFALPQMRLQLQRAGPYMVLNDAYNANPASTAAALDTLDEINTDGRRVFFCGEMLELGRQSDEHHRRLGQRIADSVDVLVAVGAHAEQVTSAARAAGLDNENTHAFRDVKSVKRRLDTLLRAGDVILLKGSRAVGMETILTWLADSAGRKGNAMTRRSGAGRLVREP